LIAIEQLKHTAARTQRENSRKAHGAGSIVLKYNTELTSRPFFWGGLVG
jgi:hypothetical protein